MGARRMVLARRRERPPGGAIRPKVPPTGRQGNPPGRAIGPKVPPRTPLARITTEAASSGRRLESAIGILITCSAFALGPAIARRSFRLTARLLLVLLVGLLIEIEFSYYSSTLLLVV